MANLGIVEAFAMCGAKLDNHRWATSAFANDGVLVINGWAHYFGSGGPGILRYADSLSRWAGNELGNSLLEVHLAEALSEKRPVRMVVATAVNPKAVERESDASKIKKKFHVLEDKIGRLVEFDGDRFVIEFRRSRVHESWMLRQ